MKSVVVTGVSTGIGWGITKVLTQKGFRVFGSVRKAEDAERLHSEFGASFVPLLFDVTDEAAVQAAALRVRELLNGETLFGLVNNAGVAFPAPLIYQPTDDFRRQLEVNLVSVLIVTKAFVPLLGIDPSLKGHPGRIVNISSVGGRNGNPFMGAYAASKHGLEGFSESLRRELMLHGIDVIIVGPGAVATPIWDKAEQADFSQFANTEYYEAGMRLMKYMVKGGKKGFAPEKVGEVVLQALTTARPRVRYAVIQVNSLRRFLQLFMPRRMMDRVLARYLGFRKR
ncbi:MAG TPA: SDR family NAD(P)-dependent oxidoreductase [Anaerolineales bacterium]|nr:SDR family NAD(P)-dependent oxidoreductase [Anaerolineales bacterium]